MKMGGRRVTVAALAALIAPWAFGADRVRVTSGVLEGTLDPETGVRSFKGIPYAEPPVGDLRWRVPVRLQPWKRVRKAKTFGPKAMQLPVFGDMGFRASGMSEDCLYLNVWTIAKAADGDKLPVRGVSPSGETPEYGPMPVLVYFYGGGFVAGDGSEPRYDGASMARKGIVTVTVNYRLGAFGFLAHPGLAAESRHRSCGNYGLLDQFAALLWVRENIASFGGDPARVTIAGESAGSSSVSAQMASPLAKDLFAAAIGESGSILGPHSAAPRQKAEEEGVKFAAGLGLGDNPTIAQLRKVSGTALLEASGRKGVPWFRPCVDGWFLPKPAAEIYAAGEQARVPLLAGSNSEEGAYYWLMGGEKPTVEAYRAVLKNIYGDAANDVFAAYPATDEEGVLAAAQDLSSDRFIAHNTWKWLDLATKTGGQPTWYYLYSHPRPPMKDKNAQAGLAGGIVKDANAPQPPPARGASHSSEIEYALGNLLVNPVYDWAPEDFAVSKTIQEYFANFIRTGDPNGSGLPEWPKYGTGKRLTIDVVTRAEPERVRARYELLDRLEEGK